MSPEEMAAARTELIRYRISARYALPLELIAGDSFEEMHANAARVLADFNEREAAR